MLGDYWISPEARWKLLTSTVVVRLVGGYRQNASGGWTVGCGRERGVGC